jgi:predicted esterase
LGLPHFSFLFMGGARPRENLRRLFRLFERGALLLGRSRNDDFGRR